MPSTNLNLSPHLDVLRRESTNGDDKCKLGPSSIRSEPILWSPTQSSSEKPTTEIRLPVSPTSTADIICLVLDEDVSSSPCSATRRRLSNLTLNPSFLDSDPTFFDDEISEWSSDDDEDEDDLLGLSFVDDENQSGSK